MQNQHQDQDHSQDLRQRVATLERHARRGRVMAATMFALGASLALIGTTVAQPEAQIVPEIRTHKLTVVDSEGRTRVQIAEDPADHNRNARAAGLTIYDITGHERGGIGTMADGSAAVALDAPHGVGHKMRDRAGIKVGPDGSAMIVTISNAGQFSAGLYSKGEEGRLELSRSDAAADQMATRVITQSSDTSKAGKLQ